MANESQYYNPIVEAMVNSARLQQGAQQQGIEKERNKAEAEARKEQLKQQQKQIEYEHEHQIGMLDLQGKQHQLAAEVAKLNATLELNKGGAQGLDVKKILDSNGTSPLTQGLDPTAFQTPAGEAQRLQSVAKAQSQGQAEGSLPTALTMMGEEQKNKLALQNNENQFKQKLQDSENIFKGSEGQKERANKLDIAGLDRSTQLAISQMTNATHLMVSGMGDPNTIKSGVVAAATGRMKLDGSSPYERAIQNSMQAQGWKPLDPKEVEALRQNQQLSPIFDKLEKFADTLPSTRIGAMVQGKGLDLANAVGYTTEKQNEINVLKSQALNIGKALEGMTGGRVLMSQMQLDLDSFASGKISKADMKTRIDNLKTYYANKVDEMYLQGMPPEQKELLFKTHGIVPGFVATAPKTNKSGHKLDIEESIKRGQAVYSN